MIENAFNITNCGECHLPCAILIDSANNAEKWFIDGANQGLCELGCAIEQDIILAGRVEICVVSTSDGTTPLQEFCPGTNFQFPTVTAGGHGTLDEGISRSLDCLQLRKRSYQEYGVRYYRPHLLIVSNGYCISEATKIRLHDEMNRKRVNVCFVSINKDDFTELQHEFRQAFILESVPHGVASVFEWYARELDTAMYVNHPYGYGVGHPPLPNSITRASGISR